MHVKSTTFKGVCSLFAFFAFLFNSVAQTDTEFWFVAPEVTVSHNDAPIVLRISTLVSAADIEVSQPANPAFVPITISIPVNTTSTIDLTPFKEIIENKPADQILNYGLRIRSTAQVTAYYEVNATNNPDIFSLKGSNAKGTYFLTPFQTFWNNGTYPVQPYSGFDIVATEDNTVVTIIPSRPIFGHAQGVPFDIILNQGQTYSAIATGLQGNQHPFGSVINSTKPICVTIKDDSMTNGGCLDLMGDQIVPVSLTGTEYIVMRGFLNGAERAYVLATEDDTEVFIGGGATPVATINFGEQYEVVINDPTTFIRASKNVYVLHISGFGCEMGGALLPTIECTGSSQVFFTRSTTELFGLNIMCKAGSENFFTLNANPALVTGAQFTPVPGSNGEWVAAQIQYNLTDVAINTTSLLVNSAPQNSLFHLGIINGGANSGCRYGYFSDYSGLSVGGNQFICLGDSVDLDGGLNMDSYLWSTGDTTRFINVSDPGAYWIITSRDECTYIDTITVINDIPEITLGSDTIICGNPPYVLSPGTGFAQYLWQDGSVAPFLAAQTSGLYSVEIVNFNGCRAEAELTIEFRPVPDTPEITSNLPLCEGETLTISSTQQDGTSILWNGPNNFNSTQASNEFVNATQALNGVYAVAQTLNGCTSDTVLLDVFVFPNPQTTIVGDTLICENDTIELFAGPGFSSYAWSNSDTNASVFVGVGIYSVIVTNQFGCTNSDEITVFSAEPEANYTVSPAAIVPKTNPFQFTDSSIASLQSPIISWSWDFGDGETSNIQNPTYTYQDTGTYQVTLIVESSEGCLDTLTQTVKVIEGVVIPNVFSPNGDGKNDVFKILNLEAYPNSAIQIFNRWGNLVYQNDNYQSDWNGDGLPDGVYFYVLNVPALNEVFKGTVSILGSN